MERSRRQLLGEKFEIWLEQLLKDLGHSQVYRNVEFHKERYIYRQADLLFYSSVGSKVISNLVEAKYSSGNLIRYKLREPVSKGSVGGTITLNNLVEEVIERKNFVIADRAFLVTNTFFERKLTYEAKKHSIETIEAKELCIMKYGNFSKQTFTMLQNSITGINMSRYPPKKSTIYT